MVKNRKVAVAQVFRYLNEQFLWICNKKVDKGLSCDNLFV